MATSNTERPICGYCGMWVDATGSFCPARDGRVRCDPNGTILD